MNALPLIHPQSICHACKCITPMQQLDSAQLSFRQKQMLQEKYLHCHFTKCLKILTKDEILFLFEVGLLRHKKAMNWTEVNLHRKVARGYSVFEVFETDGCTVWDGEGNEKCERWRERDGVKQWGYRRMTAALIVTLQSLYTTKNFQWIEKRFCVMLKLSCQILVPSVGPAAGGSGPSQCCFSQCDLRILEVIEVNIKA